MARPIDDAHLLAVALAGTMAGWNASQGHAELTKAGVGIGRSRVYRAWDIAKWLSRDLDPKRHTPQGWASTAQARIIRAAGRER